MSYGLEAASVYTDFQGLAQLRREAHRQSPEALREVARQFEALFVQSLLKNMREAGFDDELFGSDQMKFYQGMFDQQMALSLSRGGGLGLADLLVRQLGSGRDGAAGDAPPGPGAIRSGSGTNPAPAAPPAGGRDGNPMASPEDFVRTLAPHAREAAAELGLSPRVLLAQAALETGWGRGVIRHPDGRSSHNLFGIKADGRWTGERVYSMTLEYDGGVAQRRREAFRAYDSYADSFTDYVAFLRADPRYRAALAQAGDAAAYTRALQQAGYATDPNYAVKINMILDSEVLAGIDAGLKNPSPAPLS